MPTPLAAASEDPLGNLGTRIREERRSRDMTLEGLAAASGVSRSMLSAVELGQKSPTILLLDRIATALGTSIARLVALEQVDDVVVLRHDDQVVARDPSGWERRILSPVLPGIEFEFMRTTIPALVNAGLFAPHATGSREYIAVQTGVLHLTLDAMHFSLGPGDSMYYAGNRWHGYSNEGTDEPCVYYLAMDVTGEESPHRATIASD